ncbi:MAG: DUF2889 domain-containing protein [Alphaproteobacteria bacterium]
MPLSPPAPREMTSHRTMVCAGYRRADGLWDIEGYLKDIRTYDFPTHDRGMLKPGEPLHEMSIRITIDEDFLIHEVEAIIDFGPASLCGDVAADFKVLKGMRIGKGFNRQVRDLLGGAKGCVHLVDLMGPVATAACQALFSEREKKAATDPNRDRPPILDQCHALASDGPVVRRFWPQFYTGSDASEVSLTRISHRDAE